MWSASICWICVFVVVGGAASGWKVNKAAPLEYKEQSEKKVKWLWFDKRKYDRVGWFTSSTSQSQHYENSIYLQRLLSLLQELISLHVVVQISLYFNLISDRVYKNITDNKIVFFCLIE